MASQWNGSITNKENKIMKTLKTYWKNFWSWFVTIWKAAWAKFRTSILGLISATFSWLYKVISSFLSGLWNLFLLPAGRYIKDAVVKWIKKI